MCLDESAAGNSFAASTTMISESSLQELLKDEVLDNEVFQLLSDEEINQKRLVEQMQSEKDLVRKGIDDILRKAASSLS